MQTPLDVARSAPTPARPRGGPGRIRLHDWASVVVLAAGILAALLFVRDRRAGALVCTLIAIAGAAATRALSLKYPGPMPHHGWWTLYLPRGFHSAARLRAILGPCRGERMLEIGPGVGIYSLPVAASLAPDGVLDVLDIQPEMLAHLARRARRAGARNIVAMQGDAQRLPYPDALFDGAYLTSVLGEIPDPDAALRELRRVLKPGGRLVVGEFVIDPDFTSARTLEEKAARCGFVFERRLGPGLAYFARFRSPGRTATPTA